MTLSYKQMQAHSIDKKREKTQRLMPAPFFSSSLLSFNRAQVVYNLLHAVNEHFV